MNVIDFFADEETNIGIMKESLPKPLILFIEQNKPLPLGKHSVMGDLVFEEMDNLLRFMEAAFDGMATSEKSYHASGEQILAGASAIMSVIALLNRRLAQLNRARRVAEVERLTADQ
jgi:hypothetical protein